MPSSSASLSFVPRDFSFLYELEHESKLDTACDASSRAISSDVGLRVVLADSETDGDNGFVGTVVEVGGNSTALPENMVRVQWDSGIRRQYRDEDLCVLDCAPIGVKHAGFTCSACKQSPILGTLWHCLDCKNSCVDLCTACYMADEHKKKHVFQRVDGPGADGIAVGVRFSEQKTQAKGIYPGAKVTRGPDWEWGSQDGGLGKEGAVHKITDWQGTPASAAVVSWDFADKGTYRLGYQGKVDLKCTVPGVADYFYKSHLQRLDTKQRASQQAHKKTKLSSDQPGSHSYKTEVLPLSLSPLGEEHEGTIESDADNKETPLTSTSDEVISCSLPDQLSDETTQVPSLPDDTAVTRPLDNEGTAASGTGASGNGASSTGTVDESLPPKAAILLASTKNRDLRPVAACAEYLFFILSQSDLKSSKVSRSVLHKAAIEGQCRTVKRLLEDGNDVDQRDAFSLTPLHLAAWYGQELVVKVLLDHGANVNAVDRFEASALQKAERRNHRSIVQVLLEKNATVRHQQPLSLRCLSKTAFLRTDRRSGFNTLQAAVVDGNYNMVLAASIYVDRFLREMDFESTANNAKKFPGKTAYDILSGLDKKGHVDMKELYEETVQKVESFSELHQCVSKDDAENAVELVLQNDVDVNVPAKSNRTALLWASPSSSSVLIESLLDLKADVNAQREDHCTALMLAVSWNNFMAVHLLASHGAKVDTQIENGETALHRSVMKGFLNVSWLLIEHGCNVNVKTDKGMTPLHFAALNGHGYLAKLLLESKADVNSRNKQTFEDRLYLVRGKDRENPAWHYLQVDKPLMGLFLKRVEEGSIDVAKFGTVLASGWGENPPKGKKEDILRQAVASLDKAQHMTPLHLACKGNNLQVINLLIERGANVNAADADGYTPLHIAAVHGHMEVVKKLIDFKGNINCVTADGRDAVDLALLNEEPEVAEFIKSKRSFLSKVWRKIRKH